MARLCMNVSEQKITAAKVAADQCSVCGSVSFIRRAWGLGEALWDENWSGLFLFPLLYLSCHYVSSAVFNDGSSLQAVSGCTTLGGGGQWRQGNCFFFLGGGVVLCHCLREARDNSGRCRKYRPPPYNNVGSTFYYVLKKQLRDWMAS